MPIRLQDGSPGRFWLQKIRHGVTTFMENAGSQSREAGTTQPDVLTSMGTLVGTPSVIRVRLSDPRVKLSSYLNAASDLMKSPCQEAGPLPEESDRTPDEILAFPCAPI